MIKISNLNFHYPSDDGTDSKVLDGINLTIHDGESIGLMGPNGSGKTTFARCLNGLLQPTEGNVWVDEFNTREAEGLNEIRRRVGMVFQNPENQIVSTTVEREIAFGLENLGMAHDVMHEIVDNILKKFNLVKYRTHPPHLLSGGEMQRLALASIFAMSPKTIIFDEPTSLLDWPNRKLLLSLVLELHEKNKKDEKRSPITTLFITQIPEEVLHFDRLLVIYQGKIAFDDKPSEVFQNVERLQQIGLNVPIEFEVDHYLKKISDGKISLNPSEFLPIL